MDVLGAAAEEYGLGDLELKAASGNIGAAQLLDHPLGEVVAAELGGGRVDRDRFEIDAAIEPTAHVGDDALDHAVADLGGDVGILERGFDRGGLTDPAAWVAPAQQRLETDQGARGQVQLRLIIGNDAVVFDGGTREVDHRIPTLHVLAHVRLEHGDDAATRALSSVERHVGVFQQFGR